MDDAVLAPPAWLDMYADVHLADAMRAWEQNTGLLIDLGTNPDIEIIWVSSLADVPPQGWEVHNPLGQAERVEDPFLDQYTGSAVIWVNLLNYGDERWNDESSNCPTAQEYDLTALLVHELGHCLGLDDHEQGMAFGCTVMDRELPMGACDRRTIKEFDKQAMLCLYPPLDSDATIDGFGIVDGVARWTVLREGDSAYYLIEESSHPDVAGRPIHFEQKELGPHMYSSDFDSLAWYRLVEVDTKGRRNFLGSARPKNGSTITPPIDVQSPAKRRVTPSSRGPIRMQTSPDPPTCMIYTDLAYSDDVLDMAYDWQLGFGQTVWILFGASDPREEARLSTHYDMKGMYQNYGTRLFLIIADDAEIAGSFSEGYFPESAFLESSDQELADLDYDGVPDVVVTRWLTGGVRSVQDKWLRMWDHSFWAAGQGTRSTSFLVGDADNVYSGSGERTILVADDLKSAVALRDPAEVIRTLKESTYPDAGDRNVTAANHINLRKPELIVLISTASNALAPGHWFSKLPAVSPPWSMSLLDNSVPSMVVIAASCGTAEFDVVEPSTAVCRDFVGTGWPNPGAVAWIGASETQTDQTPNHLFSRFVLEEMFDHPYRPMAEAWLAALRRSYAVLGEVDTYRRTLNRFVFLGDPLSPFRCFPRIRSYAEIAGTDSLRFMPGATAVVCPAGDGDHIVVEIAIDARDVSIAPTAQDLTISQPASSSMPFYPDASEYAADGAPQLVNDDPDYPQDCYKATFTIEESGGCGGSLATVKFKGETVGRAHVKLKSPDLITAGVSRGKVELLDLASFSTQYEPVSGVYGECADYVAPFGTTQANDLAFFSSHWQHEVPGGGSAPEVEREIASGTVLFEFEEVHPVIGEHKLLARIKLDGVEPFKVAALMLRNENPKLDFIRWSKSPDLAGKTLCAETVRDGHKEIFIGVVGEYADNMGSSPLGTAEFRVLSEQELALTDEDLALVVADVLSEEGEKTMAVSSLGARRVIAPVGYKNELAQNYPKPFNPLTTIAFSLERSNDASLSIYDVRGAVVRELVEGQRERGIHRIVWDGTNANGQPVASGVYFYKLVVGSFTETKKMTVLK